METARKRRSRREVDRLILDAARAVFAHRGYAGATTREIAERAGVYEPMVYRRFQSKADLFNAAVLVPFNDVVSSYLATWEAQAESPASVEELVRAFVEPLYALLTDHRDLALALVAAQDFRDDIQVIDEEPGQSLLVRILDRMEPQLRIEGARRPLRVDFPATVIVSIGMVLGVALFAENVLTTRHGTISRQQLVDEMVNYCLYGVLPRATGEDPAVNSETGAVDSTLLLLHRLADAERRAIRAELQLEQLTSRLAADSVDQDASQRPKRAAKRNVSRA